MSSLIRHTAAHIAPALCALLSSCVYLAGAGSLPARPPLSEVEEPLELREEPDDEVERLELPRGSFTGIYVRDARRSLDVLLEEAAGLSIERLVENSPGERAGLEEDDLLLAARLEGETEFRKLAWPSAWRGVELDAPPGSRLELQVDRAGTSLDLELRTQERTRIPSRDEVESFREERRAGVVLRTATEVEARRAGLPPGAGAVLIGLSRQSPWREAGMRFEDLLVSVDGVRIAYPEVLLDAVRQAPAGAVLSLEVVREGKPLRVAAPISRRERETTHARIAPLFAYANDGQERELSVLLGLFRWRRTKAAWDARFLWLISIGGGDADRLEEVSRK